MLKKILCILKENSRMTKKEIVEKVYMIISHFDEQSLK
ncbi:winged helix-turn-helix transcriptional regulator [Staphylococcus xylosus]